MKEINEGNTESFARCLLLLFGCGICPMIGAFMIASATQGANLMTAILGIVVMMSITVLVYRTTDHTD